MYDVSCIENKALKYLLKIYECGGISAAAAELYLSQPALTKYLKSLEDRLGFMIFNRYGHRLIPTFEGEQLIEYAREISAIERRLRHDVINMESAVRGRLRIALPIFRSAHILPQIIPQFSARYPEVELEVLEASTQTFESLLLEGKADFAFVNKVSDRNDIVTEVTKKYDFFVAVGRNRKTALPDSESRLSIKKFAKESFILQTPQQLTRQYADQVFREAGITPRVLFTLSNIEAAAAVVAEGCGACFLPETHLSHLSFADRLCCYRLKTSAPRLDFGIAYLKGTYMPEYFEYLLELARTV